MANRFFIYNTMTRKVEEFQPIEAGKVKMYSCGPTVYDYTHIGHARTYVNTDILKRSLTWLGYEVFQVMNITDVGHLVSDADTGEDKLEKKAKKEGLSAWQIAEKYTKHFWWSLDSLNIKRPWRVVKATDHIKEMIELVKTLERKGFTYVIEGDGIYFDTSKLADYGKLATVDLKKLRAGARVEMVPGKKHPTDFALWKFSPKDKKRQMEWNSPWGVGFPGWHIECSAMSMKYLGETLDIHTGGVDHINVHHTNEIAQSEAATGKPFANYWVHFEFVLSEGEKMSKSKGNYYRLDDIVDKGYDPLVLRYLYLTSHYRRPFNFTWDGLEAADKAYWRLVDLVAEVISQGSKLVFRAESGYNKKFTELISNDLLMPEVVSLVWEAAKAGDLKPEEKAGLILGWDEVLGLSLKEKAKEQVRIPGKVKALAQERWRLKQSGRFEKADELRDEIAKLGYKVRDRQDGYRIIKEHKAG
ncbi:MAG: cysteine--tRNA ligase [bacterium]|nr:cysteine--tRNA ligase [bacterium]